MAIDLGEFKQRLNIPASDMTLECALIFHEARGLEARGQFDDAVNAYKKVLELAPDDAVAYVRLASLYVQRRTPRAAVVVYVALAEMHVAGERWEKAALAYEKGSELAPDDAEIHTGLRDVYIKLGRLRDASKVQERIDRKVSSPRRPGAEAPDTLPRMPVPPPRRAELRRARARARSESLGQILLDEKMVSREQLDRAIQMQHRSGGHLGRILVEQGALSEQQLAKVLSIQWGMPYVELASLEIDPDVVKVVPQHLAHRHKVLAIEKTRKKLKLAISDPLNVVAFDDVRLVTGLEIEPVVAAEQDVMTPPKALQAAIVSRIKIMANLDIAERRLPQDGRIHVAIENKEFDLRVSTLPTVFGEKVVMRILDQSSTRLGMGKLGFTPATLELWEAMADKPYGMILVSGPTGSGKTTTLYSTLHKINTTDRNIMTVEDPVEYH